MIQTTKKLEQREWNYYDNNLGKALESVEKGDFQFASECFQHIVWVLQSLDKYHPPDLQELKVNMK